ncbi:hypothetical protein TRICI_006296 [Trichomonascus ciferrii]|uniref:Uncharacterized protein n=1 Tax=Trichomonascus ciferrii TaxID=44093 RepID=A0A642UQQ5_9ASCO|nr:hypothetical protein TRICI_006296 [Trichomonascus ciferrii]
MDTFQQPYCDDIEDYSDMDAESLDFYNDNSFDDTQGLVSSSPPFPKKSNTNKQIFKSVRTFIGRHKSPKYKKQSL